MPDSTREAEMLLAYLDSQRHHVLEIIEGLPDADLRRAVLPTGWSCLGMVQHLAFDVERFWFRIVFSGELLDGPDDAWVVAPETPSGTVLDSYREEIEAANAVIAGTDLETPPSNWPEERWPNWRLENMRQLILHVMNETACHAGHLDAARELIDGRTWMVLTDAGPTG